MKGKFLWPIIIWLLCCGVIIYFLYGQTNNIIQAIAIVTLVFITSYYAFETHRIVEEGRIKRLADFWEKRIAGFYAPMSSKFNAVNSLIVKIKVGVEVEESRERYKNILHEIRMIYSKKKYLIPLKGEEEFRDLAMSLLIVEYVDDNKMFYEKTINDVERLYRIFEQQRLEIESKIRASYEY